MTPAPFLTDAEIAGICDGVASAAAQRRHLERLGMLVKEKPNGRPLVARSEFERVLGAARFSANDAAASDPAHSPNVVALRSKAWAARKHTT